MSQNRPLHPRALAPALALAILVFTIVVPCTVHAAPAPAHAVAADVTGIPYLQHAFFSGGYEPCDSCPPVVCSGRPFTVILTGEFPDNCVELDGIRLLPKITADIGPPTIEVTYRTRRCLKIACAQVMVPWTGAVEIPSLPEGPPYTLNIVGYNVDSSCVVPTKDYLGSAYVPFVVSGTCSAPGCFLAHFQQSGGPCDATFGGGHPAIATLEVNSGVPVAGLQGYLRFDPPGMHIRSITPVGRSTKTWSISWLPRPDGAAFVAFSTDGSTIPPMPGFGPGVPVFNVEVIPDTSGSPDRARLYPVDLLASDDQGRSIDDCPMPANVRWDPSAVICREERCDHNGDGQADVRDLVLMVNCLRDLGLCVDTGLDCDGDGGFDLDDVLCCAHYVLGGDRPDSTIGREAPEVALRLGAPVDVSGDVLLPVRLDGLYSVGAARLDFAYPADRYEVVSVEPAINTSALLAVHEISGSRLSVGLIALPTVELDIAPVNAAFYVRLRPRAGTTPGGEFAFDGGTFAGKDGVALETSAKPISAPLVSSAQLTISRARPNPFRGETVFSVTLAKAADVTVSVFDLGGRRVATVFRGRAEPGTTPFTWRGTKDDGTRAPSGVYFYRVEGAGMTVGDKVLVLAGP